MVSASWLAAKRPGAPLACHFIHLSLWMYSQTPIAFCFHLSRREIHFARCLQKSVPTIQSYYMGFYIHSCPKMRYKVCTLTGISNNLAFGHIGWVKFHDSQSESDLHRCAAFSLQGNYSPSYLACPETFNWIPMKQCLPKLDLSNYSRLDDSDEGETW